MVVLYAVAWTEFGVAVLATAVTAWLIAAGVPSRHRAARHEARHPQPPKAIEGPGR